MRAIQKQKQTKKRQIQRYRHTYRHTYRSSFGGGSTVVAVARDKRARASGLGSKIKRSVSGDTHLIVATGRISTPPYNAAESQPPQNNATTDAM